MPDFMKLNDMAWPVVTRVMRAHTFLYRATNGAIGYRMPGLPQNLLLDHVGAKSNVKRTTPLLFTEDGDDVLIVASKGGYPKNPAWYYNLLAHPDTTVQIRGERRAVHARVAGPEERSRLWLLALKVYPTYNSYQERTDREIPIVVLEPR